MVENILIGEVDKESNNIGYSDVVFFGKSEIYYSVLSELKSYENHFQELSLTFVNELNDLTLIDLCIERGAIPVCIGMNDLIFKSIGDNFIFSNKIRLQDNVNFLGFQRHLCEVNVINKLEAVSLSSFSLGKLNNKISYLEPILRDASDINIDLSVLRSNNVPNVIDSKSTGLSCESLIQLINFASRSPLLQKLSFKTHNINLSSFKQEIEIIATCIWYFLEGLNLGQYKASDSDERYYVTVDELDQTLIFIHSLRFNKWWLTLENDEKLIACTFDEYQKTISGEMPDRILQKLIS